MTGSTTKSAYLSGVRDGLPFILIAGPFAMLFGVLGAEAGLSLLQVMGFSVLVIAGAAQFTAIQLMVDNAPTVMVLLTSLAVNLRMAMYSASLTPYLGMAPLKWRILLAYYNVDQSYALAVSRWEDTPDEPLYQKIGYFFGVVTPLAPTWYGFTLIGALLGSAIPPEVGLDFAMPITFLAMIGPLLKTVPHLLAAITSVVFALLLASLPFGMGLLIAGGLAMAVGAEAERRMA